jgi:hypothetical protein
LFLRLLFCGNKILPETVGVVRAVIPVLIRIDEEIFQFGMFLLDFAGFLTAHSHKGGGVSIGGHAVGGNDGGAEDGLGGWITSTRIDGVGIFLAIFDVEVTVIA